MRQVIQSLRGGDIEVLDVPMPVAIESHVVVQNRLSVISPGTEGTIVRFAQSGWAKRVLEHPERVRQVVDKIRTDGITSTIKAVNRRLDEPIPLGYSSVGVVTEIGPGVTGISVGDRVASVGHHAEFVAVPQLLAHAVPENVTDETAAFTSLATIALHAFRSSEASLGESVLVIGLGVLGRLVGQIANASGCEVFGLETQPTRATDAQRDGIRPAKDNQSYDVCIIATSSSSREPIDEAVARTRRGGRIVLLGTADIQIDRAPMFEKELTFQVARSLGPGRYERGYEVHGEDIDPAHVRWTEGRNMAAVLELMARGDIDVSTFDWTEVPVADANRGYDLLASPNPPLAVAIRYSESPAEDRVVTFDSSAKIQTFSPIDARPGIAVIGAGNYSTATLLPILKHQNVEPRFVVSQTGFSSVIASQNFGYHAATTQLDRVLESDDVDIVFIATRHDSHAEIARRALEHGKHVWVEKPLAIDRETLDEFEAYYRQMRRRATGRPVMMVGFNRRFAPMTQWLKDGIDTFDKRQFVITINESQLPSDHWLVDPKVGGGVFVGTAIHYLDLLRYLSGSPIDTWSVVKTDRMNGQIQIAFENGDIGTIAFSTDGHPSVPKETIKVFGNGQVFTISNYRTAKKHDGKLTFDSLRRASPEKGHRQAVQTFLDAVRQQTADPIDIDELFEVHRIAIAIENA